MAGKQLKLSKTEQKTNKYFDGRIKQIIHAQTGLLNPDGSRALWCEATNVPEKYIVGLWPQTTCKKCLAMGGFPNGLV